MKLFYSPKDIQKSWEENLTEEQIDEMEKQGTDVSELRAKLAENKKKREAAGETDLSMLDAYRRTPRDVNSDFIRETVGKPPLFGKAKWTEKYANAEIIFPVLLQCSPQLHKVGNLENALIALIYASDSAHKDNYDFLRETADKLVKMREGKMEAPKSLKKVIKDLNKPTSSFYHVVEIPEFENATLHLATYFLTSQSSLPGSVIPNDRVLPALLLEDITPKVFHFLLIDGKFYKR